MFSEGTSHFVILFFWWSFEFAPARGRTVSALTMSQSADTTQNLNMSRLEFLCLALQTSNRSDLLV